MYIHISRWEIAIWPYMHWPMISGEGNPKSALENQPDGYVMKNGMLHVAIKYIYNLPDCL